MTVAGRVDGGEADHTARRLHRALELPRAAGVEDEVLSEAVDALLVTVQLVRLDGRQAAREHAVRVAGVEDSAK